MTKDENIILLIIWCSRNNSFRNMFANPEFSQTLQPFIMHIQLKISNGLNTSGKNGQKLAVFSINIKNINAWDVLIRDSHGAFPFSSRSFALVMLIPFPFLQFSAYSNFSTSISVILLSGSSFTIIIYPATMSHALL